MRKNARIATVLPTKSPAGKRRWWLCPLLVSVAFLNMHQPVAAESIYNLIESDKQLGIFRAALKNTAFWKKLSSDGVVTLFVPSDEALRNEGSAFLLERVLISKANRQRLEHTLAYHIYFGTRVTPEAVSTVELRASNGECLPVYRAGSAIRVGPEAVVTKHIPADNGEIFVIDRLLLPPWNSGSCRMSAALDKTALD